MSITTTSTKYGTEIETTTVTHVGRVIDTEVRCNRVMSDIYADCLYAWVIEDDGSMKSVHCKSYFECDTRKVSVTKDAAPEWLRLAAAKTAVKLASEKVVAQDRMAEHDSEQAVANLVAPKHAQKLVVTRKGKNVKNGETGVCFWIGQSKFDNGLRVGFISDEDGSKKYVGMGSCRHLGATKDVLETARKNAKDVYKDDKAEAVAAYEAALLAYNEQKVVTHWIALGQVVPELHVPRTELGRSDYAGT